MNRKRLADIVTIASQISGFSVGELRGRSRVRELVNTRFAIYVIGIEHGHSQNRIGRLLLKDHTTVGHGVHMASELIVSRPDFAELLTTVRAAVEKSTGWLPDAYELEKIAATIPDRKKKREPIVLKQLPSVKPRNEFKISSTNPNEEHGIYLRNNVRNGSKMLAKALAAAMAA